MDGNPAGRAVPGLAATLMGIARRASKKSAVSAIPEDGTNPLDASGALWTRFHGAHPIPCFKSRALHHRPAAGDPVPCGLRAPSWRRGPKRSRAVTKASFTNNRLPITAPSVNYLTRRRSIFPIDRWSLHL